jgi:hypothetical protein
MEPANEFQPLMDAIFREKVLRARAEKSPGILSLEGLALFDEVIERMRSGVRDQLPAATEDEVTTEVNRRLEIKRRIDEYRFYRNSPP